MISFYDKFYGRYFMTLQETLHSHFVHLHAHPELSFAEVETTSYIVDVLARAGIEVIDCGLKTGCVAIIRGGKAGESSKTIALRADIDALPIDEGTNLPYKSQKKGCAHACGHDFHTTALLGAAFLLQEAQKDLCVNVKLIFQPSEEQTGGSTLVINTKVLDDVSEIYGLHVMPSTKSGVVQIKSGSIFSSAGIFKIEVKGIGGHAAMPHQCRDPIVAAAALICAAQSIVSRRSSPKESIVLSFTHIEGGSAWNIISDEVFIEGTIRALGNEMTEETANLLQECCRGIESIYGVQVILTYKLDTPAINNDQKLCAELEKKALNAGFEVEPFIPTMAAEDFAVYQQKIPGVFFGFSMKTEYGLHHPKFSVDPAFLEAAGRILFSAAAK
ncbi:MAG: S-alkyl-N-acetyl-metabolite deacetylase SndA [Termitinemataceae bacterium]|nr:MAG: S-alkyl-N-acetyl-metabolite deacetylase SndA [Termitinemataceae bacterium]